MLRRLVCALIACSLLAPFAPIALGQESLPRPLEAEAKIEAALGEPTKLNFTETPLSDVAAYLAEQHKIPIQLDLRALTDAGLGSDSPLTRRLEGMSLRSALRLLLGELDLTYVIRDEVLLITSKTEAENMLIFKVHPVRDLVAAESDLRPPLAPGEERREDFQQLIELITSCVGPTTWDEVGGPGSVKEFRHAQALAFSQTGEIHEEIAALLAVLRRTRDKQLRAAAALAQPAEKPQAADLSAMRVKVYRLDQRAAMLSAMLGGGRMGGGGMGGGGGGMMGGGMGGGFFATSDNASDAAEGDSAAGGGGTGSMAAPKQAAGSTPATAQAPASNPNAGAAQAAPPTPDPAQFDKWAKEISALLPEMIAPESWAPRGKAFVRPAAGSLVVLQSEAAHQQIAQLLRELLPEYAGLPVTVNEASPRLAVPGPQIDWPQEAEPQGPAREAAIQQALDGKIELSFGDQPLIDVVEFIKERAKLDVQLDAKALTDAGLGFDTPITCNLKGLSLRAALHLLLGQLDLTYVVRNEVLIITSKTEAENMLACKVYPVFDLVVRPSGAPQRGRALDYQAIVESLTSNIAPTTWDEVGGPGAIQEFSSAGALVISQTTEVHEAIARYLKALRDASVEQK